MKEKHVQRKKSKEKTWYSGIPTTGIWASEFRHCRNSDEVLTIVKIQLSFQQCWQISTIVQNPMELRQIFILLKFSLSIFRWNFDNAYCSCLFYCPISIGILSI